MPFPHKLVWQCFWLRNGVDLVELSLHKTAFPNTLGTNCGVRRDKEIGVLKLAEDKTTVEYDTLVRHFSQTNLNTVSEPQAMLQVVSFSTQTSLISFCL